MIPILLLKTLHILSGAVLFGTGLGIAFFMLRAHRSGDPRIVAAVGGMVILADLLFTATAVVLQPITGMAMALAEGFRLDESWILASLGLYLLVGACWLPVVWIQVRITDLARAAAAAGEPLPPQCRRLYRAWFALGWPAFAGVIAIYLLMVFKPVLWVASAAPGG